MHRVYVILFGFILLGCSSNDVKVEPAPLPVIEEPIKLDIQWRKDVGEGVDDKYLSITPVFSDSTVYMADLNGLLVAYTLETGKKEWKLKTKEPISGGLTLQGERLWYGTLRGDLVCVSAEDGREIWRQSLGGELLAPVTVDGSLIIAQTGDGKVLGLMESDGRQAWVFETAVPVLSLRGTSRPQAISGAVIAAFASGKLVALNRETGLPIWDRQIAIPKGRSELEKMVDIDGKFIALDNRLHVASFQGRVAAIELFTGKISWQREMSTYVDLAATQTALYISDSEGALWALDPKTGETIWKQDGLKARTLSAPQRFQEYVVVGDFEGYLHWLSAENGAFLGRIKIDRKGVRSQPIVQKGSVFVTGVSGQLARVELKKP